MKDLDAFDPEKSEPETPELEKQEAQAAAPVVEEAPVEVPEPVVAEEKAPAEEEKTEAALEEVTIVEETEEKA